MEMKPLNVTHKYHPIENDTMNENIKIQEQPEENTGKLFDHISNEISSLLSPNSLPEILFLESILDSDLFSSLDSTLDSKPPSTSRDVDSPTKSFHSPARQCQSPTKQAHHSPTKQSHSPSKPMKYFDSHSSSMAEFTNPPSQHNSAITIQIHQDEQERIKEWEEKVKIVKKLRSRLENLQKNSFAHKLNRMPYYIIAFNRLPAIITTIILEMGVSLVISSFEKLIQSHMLIAAFFPVLSAIAGNIGLQASTATLRALATGHASTSISSITSVVYREVLSSGLIGLVSGTIIFLVSSLWSSNIYFGLATGFAILLNSIFSGILGSIGPMMFKLYGVDPALMAGPFETALQDVIGTLIYLILASLLL